MDRSANLLGALSLSLYDCVGRVMQEASGLSSVDAATLNAVVQTPGCSISVISTTIGLTHAGAVRVVDRLERDQIVERRNGVDGRTVGVFPTVRGRLFGKHQTAARARFLDGLIEQLNPTLRPALTAALEQLLTSSTFDASQAEQTCRLCHESSCPQSVCPVTLAAK